MALKRRVRQKTDYTQRLGLLKSNKPRLVIRRSLNNIHVQIIVADASDKTAVEVSSKSLKKRGWKGHCGNMPAAYLTGYAAGLKALRRGIKDANVDIGLHMSIKGSSLYAAALGARDAGVSVQLGKEAAPDKDRITGKHIAEYAKKIKGSDKYNRQFSSYVKSGLAPEDLEKHFEEIKNKIASELGTKIKKEAEAAE